MHPRGLFRAAKPGIGGVSPVHGIGRAQQKPSAYAHTGRGRHLRRAEYIKHGTALFASLHVHGSVRQSALVFARPFLFLLLLFLFLFLFFTLCFLVASATFPSEPAVLRCMFGWFSMSALLHDEGCVQLFRRCRMRGDHAPVIACIGG